MKKIISLIGARPQFVKEAIVGHAVRKNSAWQHIVVNSGQHYDTNMSSIFFDELQMPKPDYALGIGSDMHGAMTAKALMAMENLLIAENPDALIVYGDTNTTLAGALAAVKLHIPIIHIEAGIRMQPQTMPEEINRILTDRIASIMCCCSNVGVNNLAGEGITDGVHMTGDIMYDLFCHMQSHLNPKQYCQKHGLNAENFILVTLHRDYNVDNEQCLSSIIEGLVNIQKKLGLPVIWPMHPRTRKRIEQFNLETIVKQLQLVNPMGYVELMSLASSCTFVITDSGGLQKEAYYAKKRSMVVMPDTGWRELIDSKWNILAHPDANDMLQKASKLGEITDYPSQIYGDGNAASNIIKCVVNFLQ